MGNIIIIVRQWRFYMRRNRSKDKQYFLSLKKLNRIKSVFLKLLAGESVLILIHHLCYNDYIWFIPLQLFLIPYFRFVKNKEEEFRKTQYENGFRELLQSVTVSLQAGYSVENACREALKEMEKMYQEKNLMVKQLRRIVYGMELNIPIQKLFMNFAMETGVDDIYQFAVVLDIAGSMGGNTVDILKNSMEHLQSRLDTNKEIRVMLSGKIFEKNIMLLMPFCIFLYLRLTNPGYMNCFYETIFGHVLMTGIIILILFCFYWTEHIMKIDF